MHYMLVSQIDRLKKDYRELEHYERKLIKQGRDKVVRNMKLKREYLGKSIKDLEDQLYT
jgi:hypothetical protein